MHSATRRRAARTTLALLAGLVVGGWAGFGLTFLFNRTKLSPPGTVHDPNLVKADELDMVPGDAVAFAHVRLADLWKADAMAEFRKVVEKAGPEALKALDEGFVPAPSTADRLTVVVTKGSGVVPLQPPGAIFQPQPPGRPFPGGGGAPPPPPPIPTPPPPTKKGDPKGDDQDDPQPAADDPLQVKATMALQPPPPPPPPPLPRKEPPPPVGGTQVVVLLAFSAPFDAEKFRQANMPAATKKTIAGKDVWANPDGGYAAHFPHDKLLVVGSGPAVEAFLSKGKTDGPLSGAIKLAAGGNRHVVGAVNLKDDQGGAMARDVTSLVPVETAPILRADALAVSMVLGGGLKLEVRASYKDDAAAEEAEKAVRFAAESGRKKLAESKKQMEEAVKGKDGKRPRPADELPEAVGGVFGLGAINWLDEFLADPPVKREGTEVVATVTFSSMSDLYMRSNAVAIGLLLPAVEKVRDAAARMSDSNNLKQLALAVVNYSDTYAGRMPSPIGVERPEATPNPKPLLSWRVQILPFIEQENLYREFKLDEPWDSDHNKKLIERMPKIYASPQAIAPPGQTYYKVIVGGGAAFDRNRRVRYPADFLDGTSNTILLAEGGDPVVWTKPDDFEYDPMKPLPKLGLPGRDTVQVGMADGSVRSINLKVTSEPTIRAAITRAGGEVLGIDWDDDRNPFPQAPFPKAKDGGGAAVPTLPPPPPIKKPRD